MKKPMIKALAFATAITMVFSTPLTALADGLASLYAEGSAEGTGSGTKGTGSGTLEGPEDIPGQIPDQVIKDRIIGIALEKDNLTVTVGEPHPEDDVLTASLIMERKSTKFDGRIQTITINSANYEMYSDVEVLLNGEPTTVTEVLKNSITWDSAKKLVKLEKDKKLGNRQVKVTGIAAGTDVVTVGIAGTKYKASATVTVKKYASSFTLKAPKDAYVKHKIDMNAYLTKPADTNDVITWSVYEDGKIGKKTSAATIDKNGILTLKKADKKIVVVATGERGATGRTPAFNIEKGTPITKLAKGKETKELVITASKRYPTADISVVATPANTTDFIDWTSSNSKVVSVVGKTKGATRALGESTEATITGVNPGKATITATASSGKKVTFKVTVKAPLQKITDVVTDRGTKTVYAGQKIQLIAVTEPDVCDEAKKIKFKLADKTQKNIATVSSKGVLTANKKNVEGTVKVIAYYKNIESKPIDIQVKKSLVTGITLDTTSAEMFVTNPKETKELKATVAGDGATNDMLSWSSNKTKVATVDQNGVVTAQAAGTAKITVSAINTSGKLIKQTATIKVTQVVQKIELSKSDVTVNWNNKAKKDYSVSLKVSKQLPKGAKKETILWRVVGVNGSSEKEVIAKSGIRVNDKGKVTLPVSVPNGTVVKVRARAAYGATATATITVCNPTQKIEVANKKETISVTAKQPFDLGKAYTVVAKKGYTDAKLKDFNEKIISYTANNGNVKVMRTSKGYVLYGVKAGKATVTAKTASGKSAKITFTVTE